MIQVPQSLLAETFKILRQCGDGRRECVVYWTSSSDRDDLVDEVVHPNHDSSGGGYQIDDRWLTSFWFALARRKRSVRVQVHTHPGKASHSPTDDAWALIHTPGFLSLVIPRFATGPISFGESFLAERDEHGWQRVATTARLRLAP